MHVYVHAKLHPACMSIMLLDTCVVCCRRTKNRLARQSNMEITCIVGTNLVRCSKRYKAVCGLRCDRQASTRRRSHGADASFCYMRACALSVSDVDLHVHMSAQVAGK